MLWKWCLLLGVFTYCVSISADELYTVGSGKSQSSDDISLETFSFDFKSHQREYFWPYQETTKETWDWGVTAQYNSGEAIAIPFSAKWAAVRLGWHHSLNNYIISSVGTHRLHAKQTAKSKERVIYDFTANKGLGSQGSVYYRIADDYVYQLSLQPAGVQSFLHAKRQEFGFTWKPVRVLRIVQSASHWDLSDSNIRRSGRFVTSMRLSQEWVWLGLAYEEMGYQDKRAGYWSPQTFRTFALEFESSVPLGSKWSASVAANISRIKEDDFPEGHGSSFSLGVDYKLVEAVTLRYEYSEIDSQQESSEWSERAYKLSINGMF